LLTFPALSRYFRKALYKPPTFIVQEQAMKKLIITALLAATPLLVQAADVRVDIGSVRVQAPGVTVTFGSRDTRGYYWDGYDWRDRNYWQRHNGPRGEKYYTGRGKGVPHQGPGFCPPGQAKKGNC
jgi:hypothetical protein